MRTDAHLLLQELQNYNSLLKTIDRRMLDPTKKDTSCPGTKNKPQKDGRKGEITFRIKSHTPQCCSEGSNKPYAYQDPETPQRLRTVFECLLWRYRSAVACRRGQGSGCSRPGYGISPLGAGCH